MDRMKKTANTLPADGRDIRVAGRYKLGGKIGSGAFGDIYLGRARWRGWQRLMRA